MSIQTLSPSWENTLSLSIDQSWTEYQLSLSGFDRCKNMKQDQSRQHGSQKPESEQF